MVFYRTKEEDDPYYDLWNSPEWLFPFKNKDKLIFPRIITVEPINVCQNECIYCGMRLMNRESGLMTKDIMRKIAGEAFQYGASVRFGGFGEPLLHKDIVEFVRICKQKNVKTTIFTNARLLTNNIIREFCGIGLDELRISSSGITEAEHNEIRKNSDWSADLRDKILLVDKIKKDMKSFFPYLTLHTGVFDYDKNDFKNNLNQYINTFLPYVDKINIDLINLTRVKHIEAIAPYYPETTIREVYKPCVTLYHKMIVHWNGDVFACDVLYNYENEYYCGTLKEDNTIYDMYHSQKMKKLRMMTESLQHAKLPLCKLCFSNTYKYEKLKKRHQKSNHN